MQAFTNKGRKETSPKCHCNTDLNQNKRLGYIFRRFMGISADQSKSEKITPKGNQLNSNFYKFIWLAEDQRRYRQIQTSELRIQLKIKAYRTSKDHDLPDLAARS